MPNHEFIKNRSFEIAWAVFRCASLVKRESLKKELENNAIALVAVHGNFKPQKHTVENLKNLFELEKLAAIIKLAEAIGEIKIVNARVLYRELNNLSNAIKDAIEQFELELIRQANEDVVIDDIFVVNQNLGLGQAGHKDQKEKSVNVVSSGNVTVSASEHQFPAKNIQAQNETKKPAVNNPATNENRQTIKAISGINSLAELADGVRQNMNKSINALPNKPVAKFSMAPAQSQLQSAKPKVITKTFAEQASIKSAELPIAEREDDSIQDSWQNLIYRKIKEIGRTSTKEISSFFPEISERTVRFYLQRLTDAKLIEKIGTTGPGSYYVFKN